MVLLGLQPLVDCELGFFVKLGPLGFRRDEVKTSAKIVILAKGHSRRSTSGVYHPRMAYPKHHTRIARLAEFLALSVWLMPPLLAQPPAPLTQLSQLRSANIAVGNVSQRVKVTGVVIQETIFHNGRITIQDATGGCTVVFQKPAIGNYERPQGVERGQQVQIDGYAVPGEFANYVMLESAAQIAVLGPSKWPDPIPLTRENILSGACDSMFVEVRGTVRTITTTDKQTTCEIACEGLRVTAESAQFIAANVGVGAQVRVRGICFAIWNLRRQLVSVRVICSHLDLIKIERLPLRPEEIPLLSSRQLFTAGLGGSLEDRVKVQGTVLHRTSEGVLFLRDGGGGLRIECANGDPAKPGEWVEVLGFPKRGELTPLLENGEIQRSKNGPPPAAHPLTPEQFLADFHEADLVSTKGVILDASSGPDGGTLLLQCGAVRLTAKLGLPAIIPQDCLEPGSYVKLTGISVLQPDRMRQIKDLGLLTAESLTLLLRSPADIEILQAAPWWTLQKALVTLGWVSLLALLIGVWTTVLRRKVAQQTAIIGSKVRRETLHEDRLRIARELHDTLDQELLGISLHLDAAEKAEDLPDHARQSVGIARKLIHRSRTETKQTVWELRGGSPAELGLAAAVESLLCEMRTPAGPLLTFQVTGVPTEIPQPTTLHFLRIIQEALTNAITHADARNICVHLDISEAAVSARITDDGQGFDPQASPRERSFGLLGMHERANKIEAQLDIRSTHHKGTEIILHAPFPTQRSHPIA